MENKALERLEALRRRNADKGWVNLDLYRLFYKPDLYEVAYEKIKSTPGNMTPGVDRTTLDGFSFDTIARIIQNLRNESFQFKPAKRVFIPKANGKMRPLSVPSPKDKIVQEVIHMILEAIYDNPYGTYFHDSSHGFRPNRSCHTALREFACQWNGVVWIIEGDIQSCFDEIDHHVLVSLLRRKIADDRFINLIWKSLQTGYLWKKEWHDTPLGSGQGNVCSPMLANIYLHELDVFVEGLKQKYECGKKRKPNPAYQQVKKTRGCALRDGCTEEVRELTKQLRSLPSVLLDDPEYIRIKYIRYADDWIVGVTGPRSLAEKIKEEIRVFLKETLKLTLSEDKTHICHAKTEEALFLGTRLKIGASAKAEPKIGFSTAANGRKFRKRVTGWKPMLKAPIKKLIAKLHSKGFCTANGFPTSKGAWTVLGIDQILNLYNGALWGLLNYYRFVRNFARMTRIQYILQFSLAKTLAHKLKVSMKEVFRKHGKNLTFQWELPDGRTKVIAFKRNTDWTINVKAFRTNPVPPDLLTWHLTLRTRSKLGFPCLICGSANKVQMHHVRHIRKMGDKKPTGFTAAMAKLNRKQVPLCEECHQKVHRGEYDGIRLQDLAYDFVATAPT